MLSDSPPERDVTWTEAGIQGAGRFIQRVWRVVDDLADKAAPIGAAKPAELSADALALRRAAHKGAHAVAQSIEGLRFNVAVAQIYEFTNVLSAALAKFGSTGKTNEDFAWVFREAGELFVQMIGPMLPHLGEECWARLGYNTLLANQPWPGVEAGLLVDDKITIAVQVNGKRRDELLIARDAAEDEIKEAALKLEPVIRALEGRQPKKIIVVPQKIVSIVA
jgi:leucyl-tRNA synthetase